MPSARIVKIGSRESRVSKSLVLKDPIMAKTLFPRRGASTKDDHSGPTKTTSSTTWPSRRAGTKQKRTRNAARPRARLQETTTTLPKQSSSARRKRSFGDASSKKATPIPYSMILQLRLSLSTPASTKATNSKAPSIGLATP